MLDLESCLDELKKVNPCIEPKEYAEYSTAFIFYMQSNKALDGALLVDRKTGDVMQSCPQNWGIIPKDEIKKKAVIHKL